MLRVKICGITRREDALLACDLGADAIGFIFYAPSPRSISGDQAAAIAAQLPPHVARIGVFVETPCTEIARYIAQVKLDAVQLHGDYQIADLQQFDRQQVIAVARVSDAFRPDALAPLRDTAAAILLDTHSKGLYGGTGQTFDWQAAVAARPYGRIILAGGLGPANVRQAVDIAAPYALDVSSGVEAAPGTKDPAKLQQLFDALKDYRYECTQDPVRRFPLA
ncbi:phosphoribosylanthranilate isomerase [candidate division KSB3 bacterium]|uniref:N-(5'-phosphoribosyl)anthranilate isomerase n=1 Tax=candidate division KSB3 bacterium TaxID=2044937 RepID=A0A9D5JWY9_9BACT|nr:phosphoribosylanthranilate isomerase [candidate division KSB3 bacterium]MBD3325256.1 phosphoribosylanthranilate isomerase [candidate division KSB3 bacterium]